MKMCHQNLFNAAEAMHFFEPHQKYFIASPEVSGVPYIPSAGNHIILFAVYRVSIQQNFYSLLLLLQ